MTAIELLDQTSRSAQALIADAPAVTTKWQGREMAPISPRYFLGFALVVLVCLSAYLRGSRKANKPSRSMESPPSPVSPPLIFSSDFSAEILNNYIAGSWIGSDEAHEFGKHLTTLSGSPIKLAINDFYVVFQLPGQENLLFLPSPLFIGKKDGDVVEYLWDGKKQTLRLQDHFEQDFAKLQAIADKIKPGSGLSTYQFDANRPKDSLRVSYYTLSPQAKEALVNQNASSAQLVQRMVAPTKETCAKLTECFESKRGLAQQLYVHSAEKFTLLDPLFSRKFSFSLIADERVIYLTVEFQIEARGKENPAVVNRWAFLRLDKTTMDPNSIQVSHYLNELTISYRKSATQTV